MTTTAVVGAPLRRTLLLLVVVLGVLAMHALPGAPTASAAPQTTPAAPHTTPAAHVPPPAHHEHEPAGTDGPSHHDGGPASCDLATGAAASGVAPLVTALAGASSPSTDRAGADPGPVQGGRGLPPTTGPPGPATSCVLRT